MLIELDAIFSSPLATTVFTYGSAAMLVIAMAFVTFLETGRSETEVRTPAGAKILS